MSKEIICLITEKNERGIDELLQNYAPLMRYIISPILPNEQDIEECLYEVVMRIWDKIDTYDSSRGKWNTWLTAITRNAALNKARKKQNEKDNSDFTLELLSSEISPEEAAIGQERKEMLRKAIKGLPIQSQVLFYRKYYYLQSTAQIASELGMTERAVEGKLYRLKKKLRDLLGGEFFE